MILGSAGAEDPATIAAGGRDAARGSSEIGRVGGRDSSCRLAAVKRKMGATNGLFGVLRPAEVPCFYNDLGVVRKTAKPLCAGSIPARASKLSSAN